MREFTENEIKIMEHYREYYANTSYGDTTSIQNVLNLGWKRAKEKFLFQLFGDEPILSKDLTYQTDLQFLTNDFCDLLREPDHDLFPFVQGLSEIVYSYGSLYRTLNPKPIAKNILDLIEPETLARNEYTGETFKINLPEDRVLTIQKGCKPCRILGKIASAFKVYGFEGFRIAVSQILNQKELSGKLCISIHPMDYFTMSDNACDWDSCMSWMNSGCYRHGTIEMMNSDNVIVAYLESEDPMVLSRRENLEWNSKKWRELFYIDQRAIFGVKGYPYEHTFLENCVIDWLRELAEKNLGWKYTDRELFNREEGEIGGIIPQFTTHYMYNDISGLKTITMCIGKDITIPENQRITFNLSGPTQCIWCGAIDIYLDDTSDLACSDCCEIKYCYECGERLTPDDPQYYGPDGNVYCEDCYNQVVANCDSCEEAAMVNDLVEISLSPVVKSIKNEEVSCSVAVSINENSRHLGILSDDVPFGEMDYKVKEHLTYVCSSDCLQDWCKKYLKEGHSVKVRSYCRRYYSGLVVYPDDLNEQGMEEYHYELHHLKTTQEIISAYSSYEDERHCKVFPFSEEYFAEMKLW